MTFGDLAHHIDGNWSEIGSFLSGISFCIFKHLQNRQSETGQKQSFLSDLTIRQFANGSSLFPLAILTFAPLTSDALTLIAQSNRILVTIAALIAIKNIIED